MHGYINGYFEKSAQNNDDEWLDTPAALSENSDFRREENKRRNRALQAGLDESHPVHEDHETFQTLGGKTWPSRARQAQRLLPSKKLFTGSLNPRTTLLTNALIDYDVRRGVNTPRESFEKLKEDGYGEEQLNTIKAMIRAGIIQADAGAPRSGKTAEEKTSGTKTELAGLLNPVNLLTTPIGPLVSMGMGIRKGRDETPKEEEARKKETWKNILIPFRAPHNLGRRMEADLRSNFDDNPEALKKFKKGNMTRAISFPAGIFTGLLLAKILTAKAP
jgi:hypothetical protein